VATKMCTRAKAVVLALLLVTLAQLLPLQPHAAGLHSHDDAMIVRLVAQHTLTGGDDKQALQVMIAHYQHLGENLSQACEAGSISENRCQQESGVLQDRINNLLDRMQQLQTRRRRTRRSWFGKLFRGVARALGKGLRFAGRTVKFVATEVVPEVAREMIKAKVRLHVGLFLDRIVARLGPLGPEGQHWARSVLDRWVGKLRGRIAHLGETPTEQEEEAEEQLAEQTADFESYWEDEYERLVQERRNCQISAVEQYRTCLEQGYEEESWENLLEECQPLYDQIPGNDSGGIVRAEDCLDTRRAVGLAAGTEYFDGVYEWLEITYDSEGGAASGYWIREDHSSFTGCKTVRTASFEGHYSLEDCSMSGEAFVSYSIVPVIVGYEDENGDFILSRDACFVTDTRYEGFEEGDLLDVAVHWEGGLTDGLVYGGTTGQGCDSPGPRPPLCVGWSAQVAGLPD
jgi:hypothetical protein